MTTRNFLPAALCLLTFSVSAQTGGSLTERYISLALQGDLKPARALFSAPQYERHTAGGMALSRQFQSRFVDRDDSASPGTGDAFADSVITAYRTYWNRALTGDISEEQAGIHLGESLVRILEERGGTGETVSPGAIYPEMGRELRERGFRVLYADAPPLKDLILWKNEETRRFSVRLSDSTEDVVVVFLSGISSMGWKDYATFGLAFTTGWVEDGKLYCVDWAYDRQSEKFEISYLKHEARHLSDFRNFPGLESADLEYRAKLTELAFSSKTTARLLDDFTRNSAGNPEAPHAYANYRVTRDVYREIHDSPMPGSGNPWAQVNMDRVNRAARSLLEADTRRLQSASP